jgi:hypothetical protein
MGYLNNASVTVDAILTTKGRELLSQGGSTKGLDIRYFALGDDEVNYDLWNPANPLGSDYYGIIIENMPVLEASPIPEQNLKSKLLTLGKNGFNNQNSIPLLSGIPTTSNTFTFIYNQTLGSIGTISQTVTPNSQFTEDVQLGYNCSYDSKYLKVTVTSETGTSTTGDSGTIITKSGRGDFIVSLKPNISVNDFAGLKGNGTVQTPVTFTGIGSGARTTMLVNISYTMPS